MNKNKNPPEPQGIYELMLELARQFNDNTSEIQMGFTTSSRVYYSRVYCSIIKMCMV